MCGVDLTNFRAGKGIFVTTREKVPPPTTEEITHPEQPTRASENSRNVLAEKLTLFCSLGELSAKLFCAYAT